VLQIVVATRSEMGLRKTNEDAVHVSRDGFRVLAALADGACGHRGGATASRVAVRDLDANLHGAAWFEPAILDAAILDAHRTVQRAQGLTDALSRMHTTLVALWLDGENGRALWSNVGDSRLYLMRQGQLRMLTVDDSIVQQMLDAGLLTEEQAQTHPQKNQLLAALGIEGDIEPHTSQDYYAIREGDAFLLCSDGWWGGIDERVMLAALDSAVHPEAWLENMQGRIELQKTPHQDNFSAIAVWVIDTDDITQPMPAQFYG
jgi:serine/threonine protein phosphatase PrpC